MPSRKKCGRCGPERAEQASTLPGVMKLTFLGTRGHIDASTWRHRYYTSLLVEYLGRRVMVDCGEGWEKRWARLKPEAIVITHPHPDHAFALREPVPPCPVYATAPAWKAMQDFAVPHALRQTLVGHATIAQQLTWCRKEGVPKMIVTHCGRDIVAADEREAGARLRRLAGERGVEVEIAHDGMELVLR